MVAWLAWLLGHPGVALAQPGDDTCAASVHRWIGQADAANDARLFARACRGAVVVIGVQPTGADTYDVQVERSTRPAFRRVGAYALQPHLEVPDFSAIPAPQRLAFEQLAGWIAANEGQLEFPAGGVPTWTLALERFDPDLRGSPVLLLVALLLLLAARWMRASGADRAAHPADTQALEPGQPSTSTEWRVWFGLFALAWVLRLAFGAWAPHHIHLGVLWVVAATSDPTELVHFGPGFPEVFGWLTRLSPVAPDYALYACNAAVGAALAPLSHGLARRVGLDSRRALALALLMACDPIAVRFGATEAYHPIVLLLSLGVSQLTLVTATLLEQGRRRPAASVVLAAALVGAQCVRVHPVAWPLVAVAPLVGLAALVPVRTRWLTVVLVTATVGGVIVLLDGAVVLHVLQSMASGQLFRAEWRFEPAAMAAALALTLLAWVVSGARGLVPAAGAHLALWVASRGDFAQSALRQATHDRLHLVLPLLLLMSCVPERFAARRAAVVLLAAVLAVLVLVERPVIRTADDTSHRERLVLRQFLSSLPSGCRTAHVAFAGHHGMFLPTYAASARPAGTFVRLDGRRDLVLASTLGEPGCTFYVHTSLCATAPGAAACADAERQLALEPVESWSFSAVPPEDYPNAEAGRVAVSISRVRAILGR